MHLNGWHVLLWIELWALYATLARCAHCVDVTALDTAASGFIVKRPVFAELIPECRVTTWPVSPEDAF